MSSYEKQYNVVLDWPKPFERKMPYPLDSTSIFSSYADAKAYAKGDGSDSGQLGGAAYVGQIITVYEKGVVTVYKIEEDRTLASIGGTDTIEVDYYEDLAELTKIKVGQLVRVKNALNPTTSKEHLAGFYIYNGSSYNHLSTSTGETNEVEGLKSRIESVEGKISDINTDIYDTDAEGKTVLGIYTKSETDTAITTALSGYVETSTLEGYATTKALNDGLASKANTSDLENFESTVAGTYATKQELSDGLAEKSDSTHTHDDKYAPLADFTSLKEAMDAHPNKYFLKSLGGSSDYAASYQLWQKVGENESVVDGSAVINIPKDMVVSGGEVVDLAEGNTEGKDVGTYIKLTLANATNDTLYIPVTELVNTYSGSDYITVSGYTISLNTETLASSLAENAKFTSKYYTKAEFTTEKETLETSLQGYADTAASKAKSDAITEINTTLEDYVQTSTLYEYVDNETYGAKVEELSDAIAENAEALEAINAKLDNDTTGNSALSTRIDNLNTELGKTNETVAKNAGEIVTINSTIESLGNSTVKTVVIGDSTYTPSNGTITISLAGEINNENEILIPSVGAVSSAIETVKINMVTVDVRENLLNVEDAQENVIYISGAQGSRSESILIGDSFYQLGSDVYATKDIAIPNEYDVNGNVTKEGSAGLMSAGDKSKLDAIIAITSTELSHILEAK